MIVASTVFLVLALVTFVLGLFQEGASMFAVSMGSSVLAGLTLFVGVRQGKRAAPQTPATLGPPIEQIDAGIASSFDSYTSEPLPDESDAFTAPGDQLLELAMSESLGGSSAEDEPTLTGPPILASMTEADAPKKAARSAASRSKTTAAKPAARKPAGGASKASPKAATKPAAAKAKPAAAKTTAAKSGAAKSPAKPTAAKSAAAKTTAAKTTKAATAKPAAKAPARKPAPKKS